MKIAAIGLAALAVWLIGTGVMVGLQFQTAYDRIALGEQQQAVKQTAGRVEAWRGNVEGIAERLEQRQQALDAMVERYFGTVEVPARPSPAPAEIGAAIPEAAPLARIEQRQLAFAETLTMAVAMRAREAEGAIRAFGLNPNALARSGAMGGPYIAARKKSASNPSFARLDRSLRRLDAMERTLLAIPNSAPAWPMVLSSGFGYRVDPFLGSSAMHAGLDITGAHGAPIRAAAGGRVVHAAPAQGYGYLVTIDHGHGLETRYGHLSGFAVKHGDVVARGQQIARMGSTGRSTGTHLHFEVRVHGRAINPRPFLGVNKDVLEVQNSVERRVVRPRA